MSRIDKRTIDRILEVAKIEEVVMDILGPYDRRNNRAGLKKRGIRYEALCPFHEDHTLGSFVVYPKGNCYKCFSCGAGGGVVDFVMNHENLIYPDAIRWLGKKYNIETDMNDFNYTPPPPRPAPPPLDMLTLPMGMVKRTRDDLNHDNLVRWMRTGISWDSLQKRRIDDVLTEYPIGHGRNGHTIFWQIDEENQVRTGKMMLYKPDGHRDRKSKWNFDYIHSSLSRKRNEDDPWPYPDIFNPDKQEARITFFGMHLLNKYPSATVKIVESEKTAMLMAIAYGNHTMQVWIACGGLEMLTRERLEPMIDQRRRIILYPDRDGIEKWRQKAEQLHYDRLIIDTEPVTKWWREEDGEKADIADVVVRMINQSNRLTDMAQVRDIMPQATPLIDKLNLEIAEDE